MVMIADVPGADGMVGSARQGASADHIRLGALEKVFRSKHGDLAALGRISLGIPDGQFCCVVGPSGCGKTTLLRILAGLETHTSGDLFFRTSRPEQPRTAMVFQEQSVFPWMSVEQNIGYGLRMRGVDAQTTRQVTRYYLDTLGLRRFARAFPHQLSGGMKQRVSVARAFAVDPEILLMDEPFANLDEQNRVLLQEEVLKIWAESRKTVVFVTHSIDEAITLGDRIIVMTAQPGTVKADIAVSLPRPRQVYELKASPEYGRLVKEVWDLLREEVLRAKQEDEEGE